jgi:iron complex transport system ATP-binding protein
MAEAPVLELQQVSVTLDEVERLRKVSFTLAAGEVAAIIGPNGAGKTTLLRAVTGELHASSGSVTLAGRGQTQWSLQQRARQLAVLPQASGLNFPFTVAEVVALGRGPHRTGQLIDTTIVSAALAAMDVSHLRDRLYTHLSGGERQRTQLARVMAQIWRAEDADARLLLLDEPTASLDLGHQQQLMQRVRDFAAQGVAVLMVLHDLNLALGFADRLLALQQGELLANGPTAEVVSGELLRRLFGASVELFHHPRTGRPVVLL